MQLLYIDYLSQIFHSWEKLYFPNLLWKTDEYESET